MKFHQHLEGTDYLLVQVGIHYQNIAFMEVGIVRITRLDMLVPNLPY